MKILSLEFHLINLDCVRCGIAVLSPFYWSNKVSYEFGDDGISWVVEFVDFFNSLNKQKKKKKNSIR